MVFPENKKLEYEIKAPAFKGAFFLRAHYLENEVEFHGKLEVQPLGLKIFSASKRLEYTARSRARRDFLQDLVMGDASWTDAQKGDYEYYERDGLKNREFQYKIARSQSINVFENGNPLRQIGVSPGRGIPFLDVLQFFFLAPTILERHEIRGLLVSGKVRKVSVEKLSSSEMTIFWDEEKKAKEVQALLTENEKTIESMVYKLPLAGKISLIRKSPAPADDIFGD
jgi:hypothetical protein